VPPVAPDRQESMVEFMYITHIVEIFEQGLFVSRWAAHWGILLPGTRPRFAPPGLQGAFSQERRLLSGVLSFW